MFWYVELFERLPKFESPQVCKYLKSEDAQVENSVARTFIESALANFEGLALSSSEYAAQVLHAAFVLGNTTLDKFKLVLESIDSTKVIRAKLSSLLQVYSGYTQPYAKWLSEHLQRLNFHSVRILSDLGPLSEWHVRCSLVTDLNDKEHHKRYEKVMRGIKTLPRARSTILEEAILVTNNESIMLSVQQLKELIDFAMATRIELQKNLKSTTLDKWMGAV